MRGNEINRPFPAADSGDRSFTFGPVSLEKVARLHGTPLYIYSGDQIVRRAGMFAGAFPSIRHRVCYSVKANPSLSILRIIHQNRCGFDIVSGGELERVLTLGKDAAGKVVFSGVGKTAAEMDLALQAGILAFNAESEAEVELLAERAARLRRKAPVALRVNPDVFAETHPYISTGLRDHKFGIDISQAGAVYRAAAKSKHLDPRNVARHS